ncbi:MAG: T9SS type A sorting domain-containing protein [Candidatus Marinimicrobia bacterium]|nr:T9SS type A sorting domain-containing protein [Candidatus Neomarinimicrobiota bacterium]
MDDAVLSYEIYTYNELDMSPILWGSTSTTNVLDHHYVITHFEDPDNMRLWKQGSPMEGSQDFQKFYEVKVVDTEGYHSLTSNAIYAWVQQQKPSWKLVSELIPKDYELNAAFPNPFNPIVSIPLGLPLESNVTLNIYNVMGRLVKSLNSKNLKAGLHIVQWNSTSNSGQKVPSGMYIVKMKSVSTNGKKSFQKSQKIVLLK